MLLLLNALVGLARLSTPDTAAHCPNAAGMQVVLSGGARVASRLRERSRRHPDDPTDRVELARRATGLAIPESLRYYDAVVAAIAQTEIAGTLNGQPAVKGSTAADALDT